MGNEELRFGELRKYCSQIDRVSVCMEDTLAYENFEYIKDVPPGCDELFVVGFGLIESEFEPRYPGESGIQFKPCVEFMLSRKPRTAVLRRWKAEQSTREENE